MFDQLSQEALYESENAIEQQQIDDTIIEITERLAKYKGLVKNCNNLLEVLNQRKDAVDKHYKTLILQYRLMSLVLQH